MGFATTTIDFCPSCCGAYCPTGTNLDLVITGEPCTLTCVPSESEVFWISGTVDLAGGYTLLDQTTFWAFVIPGGFSYFIYDDGDCSNPDPDTTTAQLSFIVRCNATPNDSGKHLSLLVVASDSFNNIIHTFIDLTDPADWFDFDEDVEVVTPCSTYTINIPHP